jgi:multidrug efflux pump
MMSSNTVRFNLTVLDDQKKKEVIRMDAENLHYFEKAPVS